MGSNNGLDNILEQCGLGYLKEKFRLEEITTKQIADGIINEQQLISIGVDRIGSRARLLHACKQACVSNSIETEVSSIFKPYSESNTANALDRVNSGLNILNNINGVSATPSSSRSFNFFSNQQNRQQNRRSGKSRALKPPESESSPKIKTEQRRLVCLYYLDQGYLDTFTQDMVIFDGLIRFSSNASEIQMMDSILSCLHSSDVLKGLRECDIEFVKVQNKKIRKPDGDIVYDARAVLGLYKSGAIYLRCFRMPKTNENFETSIQENLQTEENKENEGCSSSSGTSCSFETYQKLKRLEEVFPDKERSDLLFVAEQMEDMDEAVNYLLTNSTQVHSEVPEDLESYVNDNIYLSELKGIEGFLNSVRSNPGQILAIRRDNVLFSTLTKLKEEKIQIEKEPEIVFQNEEGMDASGPKREYFYLLMLDIVKGSQNIILFEGEEGRKIPVHDNDLYSAGFYNHIGKLIAYSILHGGNGLPGISPIIKDAIFNPDRSTYEDLPMELGDVADYRMREILMQIKDATTEEDFDEINSSEEIAGILQNAGFVGCRLNAATNKRAFLDVLVHEVIWKRKREIEEIRKGLNVYGLFDFLIKNNIGSDICFPSIDSFNVSPAMFLASLKYDDTDKLEKSELEARCFFHQLVKSCSSVKEENDLGKSIQELITFCHGSPEMPTTGIKVKFRKDTIPLPDAETCFDTLLLPTCHGSFEAFYGAFTATISCQATGYGKF